MHRLNEYYINHSVNIDEIKFINENKLIQLLISLLEEFINNKNIQLIQNILLIIHNLQIHEEEFLFNIEFLYNNNFLFVLDKCLKIYDDFYGIFYLINDILINLMLNDKKIATKIFKNHIFSTILEKINKFSKETKKDDELEKEYNLLNIAINFTDENELTNDDREKIKTILKIYKGQISFQNEYLYKILEGIYLISKLEDPYDFNDDIIKEGITFELLKVGYNLQGNSKDSKKCILLIIKIVVNNLTAPEDKNELLYSNIISYFNSLSKIYIQDLEIRENILNGLINIAAGKLKYVLTFSNIWSLANVLNSENEILSILKIIKYMLHEEKDEAIFIYIHDTKILQNYFKLFDDNKLSDSIRIQLLIITDIYLKTSKNNENLQKYYDNIYDILQNIFNYSSTIICLYFDGLTEIINDVENNFD